MALAPDELATPEAEGGPDAGAPLLEVTNLVQEFTVHDWGGGKAGVVHAVSDVSLTLQKGETLGLVGETGSGKSTLARAILQAPPPKSGSVRLRGTELVGLRRRALKNVRRHIQMVFQDPFNSLDPTWHVRPLVEEPLVAFGVGTRGERRARADELLDLVGLDPARYGDRRPRELSGGQAQRVAIARALALDPSLIICDEPVSSLDVLIRAQVLNLLERLRSELSLSYLFIAHDLALVKQVSDRVMVMYMGKLVEVGPSQSLFREPLHPYTLALLHSIPKPDPTAAEPSVGGVIKGELPSPIDPPSGCRFRTRCPRAQEVCATAEPPLRKLADRHHAACHFPLSVDAPAPAQAATARGPSGEAGGSE